MPIKSWKRKISGKGERKNKENKIDIQTRRKYIQGEELDIF